MYKWNAEYLHSELMFSTCAIKLFEVPIISPRVLCEIFNCPLLFLHYLIIFMSTSVLIILWFQWIDRRKQLRHRTTEIFRNHVQLVYWIFTWRICTLNLIYKIRGSSDYLSEQALRNIQLLPNSFYIPDHFYVNFWPHFTLVTAK